MAAKGTLLRNNKVRHWLPWHCALVALTLVWIDTPSSRFKSTEFSTSHRTPCRLEAEKRGRQIYDFCSLIVVIITDIVIITISKMFPW